MENYYAEISNIRKAGWIMSQGLPCIAVERTEIPNKNIYVFENIEEFHSISKEYAGQRIDDFAEYSRFYIGEYVPCVPVFSLYCAGFLLMNGIYMHHISAHEAKDAYVYYFIPSDRFNAVMQCYREIAHYCNRNQIDGGVVNCYLECAKGA